MTLKEKLKRQLDTATPKLNRPWYQANQCEKIADEYAIDFAQWAQFHSELWIKYRTSELLEIFKKEKGL